VGDRLPVGLDDRHAAVVYSAASGLAPPGAAFLFSGNYNACGVSPSCGVGVMAGAAFLFAASYRAGLPTLKTHRYIGADTLRLNTLPYRAGYTARRPIDWPISQKFARGWANVTLRASDKIFDPYSPCVHSCTQILSPCGA
jgi:hypothetical protein